jgi:hypothetical protein
MLIDDIQVKRASAALLRHLQESESRKPAQQLIEVRRNLVFPLRCGGVLISQHHPHRSSGLNLCRRTK